MAEGFDLGVRFGLYAVLGLLAGMLILAAFSRFHLVPRLAADATRAAQAARRSVAVEAALGVAILAVVAWFGRLAPPSTP